MRHFIHSHALLTDPTDRLGVLLTLMFFAVFPLHAAGDPGTIFVGDPARSNSAIEANMEDQQRSALLAYVRTKAEGLTPGLSDDVRDPVRWALNGFHSSSNLFSLGLSTLGDGEAPTASDPLAPFTQPPAESEAGDPWLATTGYHHTRGILPTHDAAMMGTHTRQSVLDQYMQFDLHPYVAQNYFSSSSYYGSEVTLNFASPSDTSQVTKPWGQLVLGYTNGDSSMMDHGRGVDMHGELRFSDNLTLNSGLRQSDTTGASNYILLQWKLATE